MNLTEFFGHWKIEENPFQGEEARHDTVFARMARLSSAGNLQGQQIPSAQHSDFEKIVGAIDRPATSVVFGEKGSGKTAIRMQIADRVRRINHDRETDRVFLISYDDWNPFLDRMHEVTAKSDVLESLRKIRLVDHMDAILSIGVSSVVDSMLGAQQGDERLPKGRLVDSPSKLDAMTKRDLLVLQAVYDRSAVAGERTRQLRKVLRVSPTRNSMLWTAALWVGWLPAAAFVVWALMNPPGGEGAVVTDPTWRWWVLAILGVMYGAVLGKVLGWDRMIVRHAAAKLRRQLKVLRRTDASYSQSLHSLHEHDRTTSILPLTSTDDQRYSMLERLRRVLRAGGYSGLLVLIDRLDEPTLINGDTERMKAAVWPLLNNKFLQQDGVGFKLLLPIELRHAIFKESSAFFQEARLDKQNLVERLSWTGPMLYDLCDARLRACLAPDAKPITLQDLFDDSVNRQDIVDALDQVHQPRDAFKMLYRCLAEHCSNVTRDQAAWRVSRPVLEQVRKAEADRVQQLYRGIRPA